jgi:hypothetical protein
MKSNIFIYLFLFFFILVGCEENFEEINTKSYAPQEVNPGTLLPTIIDRSLDQMLSLTFSHNNELMQYTSMNNTVDELHWYRINNGHSSSAWSLYNRMQDIKDMYTIAEEIDNPNYMAAALILRAWLFSYLTDFFVDIPYSEGVKGDEGVYQPAFDNQETVYRGILQDLKTANSIINVDEGFSFGGDILYDGDALKWKKLSNSLLIRYYMRVSNRDEMNAGDEIANILNDPVRYPVFESNEDAAILKYTGVLPFVNYHSTSGPLAFELHNMCLTFIDKLKEYEDPRLGIFASPTQASEGTDTLKYEGVEAGLPLSQVIGTDFTKSFINERFKSPTQPAVWMSYAELEFLLAEAGLKGFISSDPKMHYENGIRASMEYWGINQINEYLLNEGVVYDGNLEQIITQKWIALYWCGMESWFDHRRTGFPELHTGEGHDNNGQLPVRYPYPNSVQTLNAENYKSVTDRLGGDNVNIKGWWEKK